ncbi:hypothetical protein SRB17_78630 [Streptomyces sp. RB17]|nr:hypothetical protein [Streptomyces sp. RB17]
MGTEPAGWRGPVGATVQLSILMTALPAAGMSAWPIRHRCKMFRAALWSALPDHPQSGFLQTNVAWSSRQPGVMKPQAEQRLEVFGGTLWRVPP